MWLVSLVMEVKKRDVVDEYGVLEVWWCDGIVVNRD